MCIYNPLYRANLAKRIQKYIGRGFKWVRPRTYESLEEYSHSLGDIREYISETCIPELTTFEEFMDAKKSHQQTNTQTACYSEDEEEGNCDYVSPEGSKNTKVIEEEEEGNCDYVSPEGSKNTKVIEEEEEGNCDYVSPEGSKNTKVIEDEYDSDVELHKKDPYQILYRNELE